LGLWEWTIGAGNHENYRQETSCICRFIMQRIENDGGSR
jgi:hypothetical protein